MSRTKDLEAQVARLKNKISAQETKLAILTAMVGRDIKELKENMGYVTDCLVSIREVFEAIAPAFRPETEQTKKPTKRK